MKNLNINNFRDVSGYVNQYGETMKPGKIFRGAALNLIDENEAKYMEEKLGIRYILDYRDENEALLQKDFDFKKAKYTRIGALRLTDKSYDGFDFGKMLQGAMTNDKLEYLLKYLQDGYKTMAFDNPAYQYLFDTLLKDDGHIYFHCTAGKDRTGVSAFLVMIALGMSEEDAIKEYLLSNEYLKASNESLAKHLNIPFDLKDKSKPLLYVQKEFISYTIQAIKEKYKDYDEFLLNEYGLNETKRKKLREIYCEML